MNVYQALLALRPILLAVAMATFQRGLLPPALKQSCAGVIFDNLRITNVPAADKRYDSIGAGPVLINRCLPGDWDPYGMRCDRIEHPSA